MHIEGEQTAADMAGWPGFDDRGRPVESRVVAGRRDACLRAALDRLDHEGVSYERPG